MEILINTFHGEVSENKRKELQKSVETLLDLFSSSVTEVSNEISIILTEDIDSQIRNLSEVVPTNFVSRK